MSCAEKLRNSNGPVLIRGNCFCFEELELISFFVAIGRHIVQLPIYSGNG
jgi:predicted XRE-type DNA-binding protein